MGARFFILRLVAKSGINNSVLVGSQRTNDVYTEGQTSQPYMDRPSGIEQQLLGWPTVA